MGILDLLTRGLWGRRADAAEEEALVPGPLGTEELPERRKSYGRFGGKQSVDELRGRKNEKHTEEHRAEEREGSPLPEVRGLEGQGETFRRRVLKGHLFGSKSYSTIHRMEKGLETIESADTRRERLKETAHFRQRVLPKVTKKAEKYFAGELQELRSQHDRELASLQRRGASDHEVKRAVERFEAQARGLQHDVDRRIGRPLRGLARRLGGGRSFWRPKF